MDLSPPGAVKQELRVKNIRKKAEFFLNFAFWSINRNKKSILD